MRRDRQQRRFFGHGQPAGGDQRLAHGDAHGTTHETEIEGGDDGLVPADGAMRDDDGVLPAGLGLGFLHAVGIALAVAELQRIERRLRQIDGLVGALVE